VDQVSSGGQPFLIEKKSSEQERPLYDVAIANLLLPLVINQSITFHLSERKNNNKNNV
jgi:hypothetical protein